MKCWLDGHFLDFDDAKVSVFDAGFQHAVGLFETMLARNRRVFRVRRHVERLIESARTLLLSERLRADPLIEAIEHVIDHNDIDEARIRLSLTGGNLGRPRRPTGESNRDNPVDPTVLIVPQPPTPYPAEYFTQGVRVMIADSRANPLDAMAGHKSIAYWPRIHALQIASTRGAQEALWFSVSNHLAGGSVSNGFLVTDGRLLTPFARGEEVPGALASPVLPGITRQAVIELAELQHIDVERRMLDINDVLGADEIFLTNSSWGILPVVAVEKETIADGKVGHITDTLREAWQQLVEQETILSD